MKATLLKMIECYEIPNTFTRDFPLNQQIALGICDWQSQIGETVAFGHTKEEALANLSAAIREKNLFGMEINDAI